MICKREILMNILDYTIVNEMWSCSACNQETNSIEWVWRGKPIDGGYLTTSTCPKCYHAHEELK